MNGSDVVVVGCGVTDHHPDCLCDIRMDIPTPPITTRLVDNWVLQIVADYFDLSWPWTPDKFAFLLEKSSQYIEAHAETIGVIPSNVTHIAPRIMEGERGVRESFPSYVKRVKQTFAEVAAQLGDKCLPSQVAQYCGMDHATFVKILSMNKTDPSKVPTTMYDSIVQSLRSGTSPKQVCNKHGLSYDSKNGIVMWLRRTFIQQFDTQKQETT